MIMRVGSDVLEARSSRQVADKDKEYIHEAEVQQ